MKRRRHLALIAASGSLIALLAACASVATGIKSPLRTCAANPRNYADASGQPVYLT